MRSARKTTGRHQSAAAEEAAASVETASATVALIQVLISLGMRAVEETLQHEVAAVDGAR